MIPNPPPNTSGGKVIHKDVFSAGEIEIWHTNADSLQNKLNELKVLLQSQSNKSKVVAITEVKHINKWQLSNSELQTDGIICTQMIYLIMYEELQSM